MTIHRTRIAELLAREEPLEKVTIMGWIRNIRPQKQRTFIHVNDGSTPQRLQVVAEPRLANYAEVAALGVGSAIAATGKWVESAGRGQSFELQAEEVRVLGPADPERYPLQPKRHSFEFLREIAHLRPRTNTFGAIFRIRSALAWATHEFFHSRGFFYVHTPILTGSDCEGAGEMFQVTKLDLANPPRKDDGSIDFSRDFFGKRAFLTVSGQLEAELLATGLGLVYTFGPTFRAENSNTPRHLAEFWMVEPEMAFYDLEDDMDLAEDYVKALYRHVLDHCDQDLAFLEKFFTPGLREFLGRIVESRFLRLPYREAIEILKASGRDFEFPVHWGMDLQTEHERYLTEQHAQGPVFVYDFPKETKAFYMRLNDDEATVAAMDLLVPKVGELVGGSQREERLEVLQDRIRAFGLDAEDYWWYLDTRRFGTVPHSGFGLGFERAVQLATGMANIRDVIPFPRTPRNLEF